LVRRIISLSKESNPKKKKKKSRCTEQISLFH
jgi:hypothetical protein